MLDSLIYLTYHTPTASGLKWTKMETALKREIKPVMFKDSL